MSDTRIVSSRNALSTCVGVMTPLLSANGIVAMTRRDACLEAFNTSPTDGSFTPPADRPSIIPITGIADPSDLLSHLDSKKIIYDHLKYKDHFNFDEKAISKIKKVSKNSLILTTEKDFARLSPLLKTDKLFYIPIQLTFFSNKEEIDFNKRIKLN
jgi:tetraacyldisaccharide-1-P 4'-kinase